MSAKNTKPVAVAKSAGKTNQVDKSLVRCEVKLEKGEWLSPDSCKVFYIDEEANFPDITYEIKTDEPGPYEWSWEIKWTGTACAQADGKKRFKPNSTALSFSEKGSFKSDYKKWKARADNLVIGGELTVNVKAGSTTFVRKSFVRGRNPDKKKVHAYLDANWNDKDDLVLIKKIFQQESRYRQFYSDEEPLVSFDNGYGIGQITNPKPNYVQAWNWKEHIKVVMNTFLPDKRTRAKNYLSKNGQASDTFTQEQYDTETMAYYNGAGRFYKWNEKEKAWKEDQATLCDPNSNRSWEIADHPNKTVKELLDEKAKPEYTGHCYAKHIITTQE